MLYDIVIDMYVFITIIIIHRDPWKPKCSGKIQEVSCELEGIRGGEGQHSQGQQLTRKLESAYSV